MESNRWNSEVNGNAFLKETGKGIKLNVRNKPRRIVGKNLYARIWEWAEKSSEGIYVINYGCAERRN